MLNAQLWYCQPKEDNSKILLKIWFWDNITYFLQKVASALHLAHMGTTALVLTSLEFSKSKVLTKRIKIEEENFYVFWTPRWISMKFAGKMYDGTIIRTVAWHIIIKVSKQPGLQPISRKYIFEKKAYIPQSF